MTNPHCDRLISLVLCVGCLLFVVLSPLVALAEQPLRIGSDKQLFLGPWTEDGRDAHLVASMKHLEMTMNPARVTGERLMVVDKPWEKGPVTMLDMNQCVIKDGDLFRMVQPAYAAARQDHHFKVYQPNSNHGYKKEYFEWVVAWLKKFG